MSTYTQAEINLQKHFKDSWVTAGYSAGIISFINEDFDKPSNSVWVEFAIVNASGRRVELGSNDNKLHTGFVDINLHYPEDFKGAKPINDYLDAIVGIFENQVVSGNHFDDYDGPVGPLKTEKGWLKTNISFPFQRYG